MTRAPLALFLAAAACSQAPDGRAPHDDPTFSAAPRPPPPPPARALAFTREGRLAVIDAGTGDIVSRTPAPIAGAVRDVAYDRWRHRAVTFAADDDEQSGSIEAFPLRASLGARVHLAAIDGTARIAAIPRGIVVFERGYGDRWWVLDPDPDAPAAPSSILPPPASIAVSFRDREATLHALVYRPDSLSILAVDASGPLDLYRRQELAVESDPPTARAVRVGDAMLVVDLRAGALTLRDGGGERMLGGRFYGARIEAAELLGASTLAVLLSGRDQLVVIALGDVAAWASVALPGAVRVESSFFSRDLLALGARRTLVATAEGVSAYDIDVTTGAVAISRDLGFTGESLRGPLDRSPDD